MKKRGTYARSFFITTNSFTLVELLVVIGILAILTAAVVIILNPAELLRQSRDATRMADLTALDTALSLLTTEYPSLSLGTASTVYVSLADSSSTCGNLSLPTLPSGYSYHCVATSTLRNIDGSGWIPVSFASSSIGSFSVLPIDPINIASLGTYYTYSMGGSWEVTTLFESTKYRPAYLTDGGDNVSQYEKGTSLTLHPYTDSGLIGYWTFDEGSGTVVKDSSGNNNTGTLTNGPTWKTTSECKLGNCLLFDGTNDYVNLLNSINISGPFTIDFFILSNDFTNRQEILGNFANLTYIELSNGNTLMFAASSTINAELPIGYLTTSNFYHLSFIRDEINNIVVYGNGNKLNLRNSPNTTDVFTPKHIGAIGGSRVLNGKLDEFRIYNRALSAGEIKTIYNATK